LYQVIKGDFSLGDKLLSSIQANYLALSVPEKNQGHLDSLLLEIKNVDPDCQVWDYEKDRIRQTKMRSIPKRRKKLPKHLCSVYRTYKRTLKPLFEARTG